MLSIFSNVKLWLKKFLKCLILWIGKLEKKFITRSLGTFWAIWLQVNFKLFWYVVEYSDWKYILQPTHKLTLNVRIKSWHWDFLIIQSNWLMILDIRQKTQSPIKRELQNILYESSSIAVSEINEIQADIIASIGFYVLCWDTRINRWYYVALFIYIRWKY